MAWYLVKRRGNALKSDICVTLYKTNFNQGCRRSERGSKRTPPDDVCIA
jgi:hypothetical protein